MHLGSSRKTHISFATLCRNSLTNIDRVPEARAKIAPDGCRVLGGRNPGLVPQAIVESCRDDTKLTAASLSSLPGLGLAYHAYPGFRSQKTLAASGLFSAAPPHPSTRKNGAC